MARNVIERALKRLLMQAAKMLKGITTTGSSVPLTMVTESGFNTVLINFKAAADAVGIKRAALKTAQTLFAPAGKAVYSFLNAARPIFVSNFGYRWTAQWAAAGWVAPTTRIPQKQDDRIELVNSISTFLTANPDFEVEKTGVTAANATDIYTNAFALQGGVKTAEQNVGTAEATRQTAETALVGQMQSLIKNLSLLPKNDPRWKAFGLNPPANKTTPDKPTGLAARMDDATGKLMLSCDAEALAERYRFRSRVAGSGAAFTILGSAAQPMVLVKQLAAGTTMEIMVQAVNGGAQSVPSDSIFFTVPATAQSTTAADGAANVAPLVVPAQTNGSRNGNGNGASNGRVLARS